MKYLSAVLLFALAIPAQAAPRWLTAVPKEIGRTYVNMFTFRRPLLAAEQWASIGALVFDEKTTMDVFARCRTCVEIGIANHGSRYGIGTVALNVALAGTLYTTLEQFSTDATRSDPSWWSRNASNGLFAIPVAGHVQAGVRNMGIRGDKLSSSLSSVTPADIFSHR